MFLQQCAAVHRAITTEHSNQIKIKSSLYSPYYAEACNELRGPSPRLSAWATQLRRSVATVASRWRHCADLTGPGIEPQTSRTDSVRFATELTAGSEHSISLFPCPKIVGFWPAGFARVSSSQALCGLISAKSWALLAASK